MTIGQTIRRLGFRKWYERELAQSHLHLVLLILAALGLLGSAETLSYHVPLVSQGKALACALVSVAIAAYALRRYLRLLGQAEFVADQAICRACSTYGRLDLLDERSGGTRLHVRCKHCSEDWFIELPG